MKALLLENIHVEAVKLLESEGIEVETRKGALDETELIEAVQDVDLLGIRSKTQVTRRVLESAPKLRAVGAFSIGVNQIDLAAASDTSIAAFNAPYSNTRSVVELAIGEIINLARHLGDHSRNMHNGLWDKTAKGSHEVRGRTLGIVGYGNIGSQLSVLAESLGMRVYFYDAVDRLALGNAVRCNSLEELLNTVETVSVHVDGRAENTNMFNAETFAMMRPRTIFLNLSRGHVVDLEALRDNLLSGHIAGAGLDVYPVEPKKAGDPFESVLQNIPNVILTPHVGGSTAEAQEDIGRFVAGKFRDYVRGGSTYMSVNLPEISLDPLTQGSRLLHLHHNVPGVMSAVNSVLGEHGVNIDRQQLATRGQQGYVVTDCQGGVPQAVLDQIRDLEATTRLTVLEA
ncbi:phosphoglycerate dehydrogenase [Gulosibacter faecalis]|uniref:D-3-phosphoglycerate dehydrogenase n=1 Tax=Gulosibacter faecalis TaxID=272240 RepID=A0ABW5UVM4_9MICO|nr:phosphoglycerate dehydrogenase [Gulosibacter faecalis]